jgi:hypothetical protein
MRVVDVLSLKSFAALLLSRGLVDLTPLNLDTSRLACKAPHADVNAQGGECGNTPAVASVRGHERVVQMLIGAGAVNREDSIEDGRSVGFG